MRAIGEIDNELKAKRFGDYLYANGITNDVDEDEGTWTVWIHDDDQIAKAEEELSAFHKDSDNQRYAKGAKEAAKLREKETRENEHAAKRQVDVRTAVFGQATVPPRLTYAIVGICVVIHVLSLIGGFDWLRSGMYFSNPDRPYVKNGRVAFRCPECKKGLSTPAQNSGSTSQCIYDSCEKIIFVPKLNDTSSTLPEVRKGQIWRLVTPIFLHDTRSIMHILFNMYMFLFFAAIMEQFLGKVHLIIFMLIVGIMSNFTQFLVNGPNFVGMSGVLYGLFGYIWIRSKNEPGSQFFIEQTNVIILMGWFVICFLGIFPDVANYAHAGGLVTGGAWGWIAARRAR